MKNIFRWQVGLVCSRAFEWKCLMEMSLPVDTRQPSAEANFRPRVLALSGYFTLWIRLAFLVSCQRESKNQNGSATSFRWFPGKHESRKLADFIRRLSCIHTQRHFQTRACSWRWRRKPKVSKHVVRRSCYTYCTIAISGKTCGVFLCLPSRIFTQPTALNSQTQLSLKSKCFALRHTKHVGNNASLPWTEVFWVVEGGGGCSVWLGQKPFWTLAVPSPL